MTVGSTIGGCATSGSKFVRQGLDLKRESDQVGAFCWLSGSPFLEFDKFVKLGFSGLHKFITGGDGASIILAFQQPISDLKRLLSDFS